MTTPIKPVAVATQNNTPAIIKPDQQLTMVKIWGEDLDKLTKAQNFNLTPTERNFATSIIYGLVDKCTKDKIDTKQLNMTNFLEQVKHFGKMQLSLQEKELYIDVRNNKNTGLKDVTISRQYQAIQKLMTRYSKKKIVRFVDGIVCTGDTFKISRDFTTGLTKIVAHEYNENIDRSKLQNIQKAYAIAYVEELGGIVPYVKIIEKKRIMTAYNCSPSYDKKVWNDHTERMVIKTAYWCLYNDIMKPYIEIPSDLQTSFAETDDKMEYNEEKPEFTGTYDISDADTNDFSEPVEVVDEPAQDIVVEDQPEDVSADFISYLDEQDTQSEPVEEPQTPPEVEIPYGEYKENPDKYFLVKGSYDPVKKTCRVIVK